MPYVLYNKKLETYLTLPNIGIWTTPDITEANSMLTACVNYVNTLNVLDYDKEFIIVDLESNSCHQLQEKI